MRKTLELPAEPATFVKQSLFGIVLAAGIVTSMQADSFANLLTDGDFDNLVVGTTPDDPGSAGQWQFFSDFPEVYQEQYSIVGTSTFDPNVQASGNSLRVQGALAGDYNLDSDVDGHDFMNWQQSDRTAETLADWQNNYGGLQNTSNAHLANSFTPVHEDDNLTIRVSFDVFVPNDVNPGDAAIYLGGDHSGLDRPIGLDEDYPEGAWAIRGPQVRWDREGDIYAAFYNADNNELERPILVEDYATDRWQRVQIDADLASATFDFYYAHEDEPLALVQSDIKFRKPHVQFVDTLVVARFRNNLAGGSIYFDNFNITTFPSIASLSQSIPEPTTLLLSALALPVLLSRRNRQN